MTKALDRWFDDGERYGLFRDVSRIQDSFDRLLGEFASLRRSNGSPELGLSPSCELCEEDQRYVLTLDLPGVAREQVQVESENGRLVVRAERKDEKKMESKKRHFSEVFYGTYSRSFALPGPVDEDKIQAHFENGVLTVTIPKAETARAKQIPIH